MKPKTAKVEELEEWSAREETCEHVELLPARVAPEGIVDSCNQSFQHREVIISSCCRLNGV